MKLYLVRHGESVGNRQRLFFGQTDYPLTELGREQAARAGEKLKAVSFDRCCASDLRRAWETAEICLDGRNILPERCPGLREEFLGDLENKTWEEGRALLGDRLENFLEHWYTCRIPGTEGARAMEARVADCVEKILAEGRDTLVVAHNGSLQLLLHHLGLLGEGELASANFRFGGYSMVTVENGRAVLEGFNL